MADVHDIFYFQYIYNFVTSMAQNSISWIQIHSFKIQTFTEVTVNFGTKLNSTNPALRAGVQCYN